MRPIGIYEIKKDLEKSENPLFLFDDDADGLCSYILLHNHIKRGKGLVVKGSSPFENENFIRKVNNYFPDVLFILDLPSIPQEFIDKLKCKKIIWIDHHPPLDLKRVSYYNPRIRQPKIYKPVSEICYGLVRRNKWLAGVGIISDYKLPKFFGKLKKEYRDLLGNSKSIEDVHYKTRFGDLIEAMNYNLKGKSGEVKKFINLVTDIKSPYEILDQETEKGKFIYKRYIKFKNTYEKLLKNALKTGIREKNLFVFTYSSNQDSFTGKLAQDIRIRMKKKIILVGREKDGRIMFSMRSSKTPINIMIEKALEGVDGKGGGHDLACGGSIKKNDFSKFLNNLKKEIKKKLS